MINENTANAETSKTAGITETIDSFGEASNTSETENPPAAEKAIVKDIRNATPTKIPRMYSGPRNLHSSTPHAATEVSPTQKKVTYRRCVACDIGVCSETI
ncbi:hypothetical protein CkaCkLH20_02209 [Colletotrichum karsti]|uniref:Uncharacterized protein n=1 Tax=Colletotrichum karsti TaxID=1095194 RepID=A0A9P6IIP8_9PEZI|nr:uncharacterized protein CkaCkLH20_02209 [Colletotrichum karsti]KAF9880255.1 hypothetical protein CkaCkLH20_02209 [Colletotrichum karsti]